MRYRFISHPFGPYNLSFSYSPRKDCSATAFEKAFKTENLDLWVLSWLQECAVPPRIPATTAVPEEPKILSSFDVSEQL